MPTPITNIQFEAGYITVTRDNQDNPTRYPIHDVIRSLDIPWIWELPALANLIVILIRTLIDREVLDESFLENDDMDLDHIIAVIEDIGGKYHSPDFDEEQDEDTTTSDREEVT